ncbi:MAG: hypothetical protein K2J83_06480 [Clostridia bacterium]|nr:hypothetical protein [Clostridia bacterium]
MKKPILSLLAGLAFIAIALCGCKPALNEDENANPNWAVQIKKDYATTYDYNSEDLQLSFYGEYNVTYVMFIDGPWHYMDVITTETVGGVEFIYPSSRTLTAYKGGKFYSLEQAYENALLTYNDLTDINIKYQNKQFIIY